MKKLIFSPGIILMFLPLFLTSCKKDKPLNEAMIGKWEVEYYTEIKYVNNVLTSEYKEYKDPNEIVMQLISGGSGIYSETGDDWLFSWSFDGHSLSIYELSQETLIWDLKMEGDKLIWSFSVADTQDPTITWEVVFTAKRVN